jgi:hypothetical protein
MGAGSDPRVGGALTLGQGPGWSALAAVVARTVPPAEIDTIYLFRPFKRDVREWGTAVVTRRAPGEDRLRVYTGRYMLIVRGKERGRSKVDVTEVALTPAEVVGQVLAAARERAGEAEPPLAVEKTVWYEG